MPTPIYPSWNDKEYDLLKKMTENTALIADYEIGDVASVAGTANQLLVNGGTAAATGNITLSLPSTLIAPGNLTVSGTATATNFIPSSGAAASGSIGGSSVYGLEIWGKTGSFSDLIIYNGAGNTLLTNLTGTQNISLAGNLTVSGTGTSSVAGNLGIGTTSPSGFLANKLVIATGGSSNEGLTIYTSDNTRNTSLWFADSTTGSGLYAGGIDYQHATNEMVFYTNSLGNVRITSGGNLTVNGTGTSSFGGKIQSSVATATGYNQLYDTTGITTGRGAFAITSTGAGLAFGIEASVGGTSFANSTAYASYFGSTTATPVHFVANASIGATLTSGGNVGIGTTSPSAKFVVSDGGANGLEVNPNASGRVLAESYSRSGATYVPFRLLSSTTIFNDTGGNVLIGTTTDSGNGKLQLATHTTSAGGIGFGTDVALYRYAAGRLAIDHLGGIDALLFWSNSGTLRALGEADGSTNTFRIGSLSAGWSTAIVSGNNTTALTLDSSQNATFAGAVTINGGAAVYGGGALLLGGTGGGSGNGVYTTDTGSPTMYMDHRGTNNTGDFYWRNGTAGANTRMSLSGAGVLYVANGTAPGSNPSSGGYLYVESGALKYRGSSGTVTTIANA